MHKQDGELLVSWLEGGRRWARIYGALFKLIYKVLESHCK
jgi:hypothetical protein